ncbi:TfuA-like protein [Azospirillum doebereinerae]
MKICVFLGPTLPVADAQALLPGAVYLPPAAQADILSALTIHRPDVIALIDGVFGQSLSVWHKEILFALHNGVAVYGASSMGALRAAECHPFGMVPVGEVARQYIDGRLTGDDEVALAHAGPEDGYFPLSEPLVNLRASLAAARAAGALDADLHDRLVAAAKRQYFTERTRDRVWAEAGLTDAEAASLDAFLATGSVDQKRLDAEALLVHLRSLITPPRPAPFGFNASHYFDVLYERDRRVAQGGHEVPLSEVATHAALHRRDFAEINAAALGRLLTVQLADTVGVTVDQEAVAAEIRRFCAARGLPDAPSLAAWCRRNDLTDAEFTTLATELAIERAMRHWLIPRRFLARTTKPVLNELRLRGLYEKTAGEAALIERVMALHFGDSGQQPKDTLEELVADHLAHTDCLMDAAPDAWSFEAGFKDVHDLRIDLMRAKQVRDLFRQLAEEAGAALREEEAPT